LKLSLKLDWKYVGKCDPERLAALADQIPFSEVASRMMQEMKVVCFHREPRTDDTSYSRAVYCAEIGLQLFDTFFNSPHGYRGAYFVSPDTGLEANRFLLNVLTPVLVSWTTQRYPDVDRDWLVESLSLPSAKAWLSEKPLALCDNCAGEWSTSYVSELEIANGRWELAGHTHAAWGRQAPRFIKVRFLGGFVDAAHQEWTAEHKQGRAQHIWEHGWS